MVSNRIKISTLLYIFLISFIDILALIISFELALLIRSNLSIFDLPEFTNHDTTKYYWIMILIIFIFINEKIYFIRYDFWYETKKLFKGLIYSLIAVFIVITLAKVSIEYSRSFLILFFCIAIILLPFFKRIFKRIIFKTDFFKIRVKVVALGKEYDLISKEFNKNWYFGYKEIKKNYDMVVIVSRNFKLEELQRNIKKYKKNTKDLYVVPYMDHLDFTHASIVDYSNIRFSAIHLENRLLNFKNLLIKEIFEKILVIVLSPLVLFIHFLICILIKLDSSGPIRFKQKRYGKNAKPFSCYKYRTMYTDSNTILEKYLKDHPDEIEHYNIYSKYQNDPRITKIGKFLRKTSLDEFPQFFNILRGDMNLIGPRPYMINEKDKIGKTNEDVILEVKPGITGLWQVSGRNELTFKERVELDKWYIQNWSLWNDFVIFIKTLKVVLFKIGAK